MIQIIVGLIKSIMFLVILEMFSEHKKESLLAWKAIVFTVGLTILQVIMIADKFSVIKNVMPIVVMFWLGGYVYWKSPSKSLKSIFILVIETYGIFVLSAFIIGCACGVYEVIGGNFSTILEKTIIVTSMRSLAIVFIWLKYEWLQRHLHNLVRYIMVILGVFILFFEQFFLMAYAEEHYSFTSVIMLFVYLTMIFTALMNLQHRHLTADNQRILDDNQRMSQEIHRSRDVIDVVSRVVATEDTIDPKLRQELADFCKSEKQEMFDPDLAASLIGDTGMDLLNALLRDKLCQCRQQDISFEAMIPGRIDTYVNAIGIGEAELLRVINDLVKNAVTAINKTDSEVREILLILAVGPSDCLELCVYDSGVPFPDFILERFGERGNTTTGTGNGLADTANTLRTYDASIEIKAIEPGTDIYTKCVRICFDGKNEIHV